VSYALDQYLWQPKGDDKHGIGVFLSAGASDGNPNPIKWAFLAGVGGKGVPGRPDDSYGVGVARTQLSGAFVPFLRDRLNLGLDHEDAFEAYYNLAITGWLTATADIQVINQALNKQLNPSGFGLMNVDHATIGGIRFRVRF
jgi:porin